jgi:hypothetical protein
MVADMETATADDARRVPPTFGAYVRAALKSLRPHRRQVDLARFLGVNDGHFSRMLDGLSGLPIGFIPRIAEFLGRDEAEVLAEATNRRDAYDRRWAELAAKATQNEARIQRIETLLVRPMQEAQIHEPADVLRFFERWQRAEGLRLLPATTADQPTGKVRPAILFRWPTLRELPDDGSLAIAAAGTRTTGLATEVLHDLGRELPYVTLAPDATCMEPALDAGDRVLFDPDAWATNGVAVVAYLVDEQTVVVKVYERAGDQVTLRGLDESVDPIVKDHRLVQIEGVVVDRVQRVRIPRH